MPPAGTTNAGKGATGIAGHVSSRPARLDLLQLEESVSFYLERSLAPATLHSYTSGQRRYMAFCTAANLQPLPLVEQTLCMFVAQLGREGLAHQTIKAYLSAVRHFVIIAGHSDPFKGDPFPLLQYVLRGIKRSPIARPQGNRACQSPQQY